MGPTKRRRILPTWLMLSRSCCVQSWFVDANSGNKFPVVTAPPVKVVPGDQGTWKGRWKSRPRASDEARIERAAFLTALQMRWIGGFDDYI